MAVAARPERPRIVPLPVVDAKLEAAVPRTGIVDRSRVVDRLLDAAGPKVATLIAPPGYGKTTVLGQWAERERRPVAWLTIDDLDNDPAILVSYLAAALGRAGPVDRTLGGGARVARERVLSFAIPRLLADIHSWETPAVLVLDDAHRLVDRTGLDALAALIEHLPAGFRVAIAGRVAPDLPLARFRAERNLLEIDAGVLALDEHEAAALTAAAGWSLGDEEVAGLLARTEGWAAAIYLATLAHERGAAEIGWVNAVSGGDRPIAAYLRSELGHGLSPDDMRFLTRSAILETVTPGAAEGVTGMPRAAQRLARLATQNLFIQAVGHVGDAYRYHNLLRDFLLGELALVSPDEVAVRHRMASAWYEAHGDIELAVTHAIAGGDSRSASQLAATYAIATYQDGNLAIVERWLNDFQPADYERYPALSVVGSWVFMLIGRPEQALHLADVADRAPAGDLTFESQRALARALLCRDGPRQMRANAAFALEHEPPTSRWRCQALWLLGSAEALLGNNEVADATLAAAIREADADHSLALAPLAKRASLALARGEWDDAARLVAIARRRMEESGYSYTLAALLIDAVEARIHAHRGDIGAARAALVQAQLVRPMCGQVGGWYSIDAMLELARAYLALSDPAGAQIVVREAEQLVRWTPSLGTLTDELIAVRRHLADAATTLVGSSALTTAELRVLPFLPTYLSFPEIADRLGVSRNTVKTHAMSIYGKLWASSRGEAVERAVELGLLEPYPGLEHRPVASPAGR